MASDSTDAVVLVHHIKAYLRGLPSEEVNGTYRKTLPMFEQLLALLASNDDTPNLPGEEVTKKLADALAVMYHDGGTVAKLLRDRRLYLAEIERLQAIAEGLRGLAKPYVCPVSKVGCIEGCHFGCVKRDQRPPLVIDTNGTALP